MTVLAPGWLIVGVAAVAAVFAIHLLNRRRLPPMLFPTARFVPEAPVRAVSPALVPTDIPLMLLRMAIVALVAGALARPVGRPHRHTLVIALADRSPGADSASVQDVLRQVVPDTVLPLHSLSAGLIAARRAALRWSDRADSVDLVIASPLSMGLWDAATDTLRARWPGRIWTLHADTVRRQRVGVTLEAPLDHPVRGALARLGLSAAGGPVRILWTRMGKSDSVAAVYTAGAAMVGRFARRDSAAPGAGSGVPIAWFADGEPAVVEYAKPAGCERVVLFAADSGDALIRSAGLHFVERLAAPCGHGWTPDQYALPDSGRVARFTAPRPPAVMADLGDPEGPVPVFPLLLALAALVVERIVRRRAS